MQGSTQGSTNFVEQTQKSTGFVEQILIFVLFVEQTQKHEHLCYLCFFVGHILCFVERILLNKHKSQICVREKCSTKNISAAKNRKVFNKFVEQTQNLLKPVQQKNTKFVQT